VRGRYFHHRHGAGRDLALRDGRAEVNRHALAAPHAFVAEDRPALESLRALVEETRLPVPEACRQWPAAWWATWATTWSG